MPKKSSDFIILICGKSPRGSTAEIIGKYAKRLSAWGGLDIEAVKAAPGQPPQSLEIEAERLLGRMQNGGYWFACDSRGKQHRSTVFAGRLQQLRSDGRRPIGFVVGGAYGLADSVIEKADEVLSFSEMTFPHELVPLLLAEQIYRASTIIAGSGYHH